MEKACPGNLRGVTGPRVALSWPTCQNVSVSERLKPRAPAKYLCVCARACVLQENVHGFLRCSSVLIFAARARVCVFVRALDSYVFLLLQYGKDASESFNWGLHAAFGVIFPCSPFSPLR